MSASYHNGGADPFPGSAPPGLLTNGRRLLAVCLGPQLVVVHNAAGGVLLQRVGGQLRTRRVRRVPVGRVVQDVRGGEVGIRAVDQRDETFVLFVVVAHPDGLGRLTAILERDRRAVAGGAADAQAQAAVHAVRRVLVLVRREVSVVHSQR